MSETFLRPGTTYLPYGFSATALRAFGSGDPTTLIQELEGGRTYERVGVDRAMAIAIDLALKGVPSNASILDVGCSVGTIGLLLSEIGYRVTGIDSDVVADVQEWQTQDTIRTARETSVGERFTFVQSDLRQFLDLGPSRFDVVLILSVLHHWLSGYGYSGAARFDREEVRDILTRLCSLTRNCVYVEVPLEDELREMPPDPDGEFVFPRWFLDSRQATDVTLVASTIATNGKPRRLYRVDVA